MNSQQETTHEVEAISLEELRPLIRDDSPARCAQIAAEAIDSGAAGELLAKLAELSDA